MQLSPIGRATFEDRYALKDEKGLLVETEPSDMNRRVGNAMAREEEDIDRWSEEFYLLHEEQHFCAGGRQLSNAGTQSENLHNCFVIPFEKDSLGCIFDTFKVMGMTQRVGGGTGFNYSQLRPAGAFVSGVNGRSSGITGFLDMYSVGSGVIEQGGSRRGANMGVCEIWHPDVWEFISFKTDHNWNSILKFAEITDPDEFENFKFENQYKWQMYNVSVGVSDEFLKAVDDDADWEFNWDGKIWQLYKVVFTRSYDGKIKEYTVTADSEETAIWKVKRWVPFPTEKDKFDVVSVRNPKAKELWDKVCYNAWADGCPGVLNFSTARRMHNGEYLHPLLATNPCAEQFLPAYGVCCLGSMVLPTFLKEDKNGEKYFDFEEFKKKIKTAVRFLDNSIDICTYPDERMKEVSLRERRQGLGTIGIADVLIAMKLKYDSDEGRDFTEGILRCLRDTAYRASIELAIEKGPFPGFEVEAYMKSGFIQTLPQDIQADIRKYGIRNVCLLTQAPTGSTGTYLGCSQGCEPWFSLAYERNTRFGKYEDGCKTYIEWKRDNPNTAIPDYFQTAQQISPAGHIKMLILFSKYLDSSASKTVNLPNSATLEDVNWAFRTALTNGVKGLTIFRDGSKDGVLKDITNKNKEKPKEVVKEMPSSQIKDPRRERPRICVGETEMMKVSNGKVYVTINEDSQGIAEVFLEGSKSGSEDAAYNEALSRLISLCFRANIEPKAIIKQLKGIVSTPVWDEGHLTLSAPDAAGEALGRYLKRKENSTYQEDKKKRDVTIEDVTKQLDQLKENNSPEEKNSNTVYSEHAIQARCASCGSTNMNTSVACPVCLDCNFSKCG